MQRYSDAIGIGCAAALQRSKYMAMLQYCHHTHNTPKLSCMCCWCFKTNSTASLYTVLCNRHDSRSVHRSVTQALLQHAFALRVQKSSTPCCEASLAANSNTTTIWLKPCSSKATFFFQQFGSSLAAARHHHFFSDMCLATVLQQDCDQREQTDS